MLDERGRRLPNRRNLHLAMSRSRKWKGTFQWNQLLKRIELCRRLPAWSDSVKFEHGMEWQDRYATDVHLWWESKYGKTLGPFIHEIVLNIAQQNSYNPIEKWLKTLVWDKVERVDRWLSTYLHCDQPEQYVAAIGPKFLISACARACDPGCKVDTVMVLEGAQGTKKSTVVEILAGKDYTAVLGSINLKNKDARAVLGSHWMVEMDELAGLSQAKAEVYKSYISTNTDTFRPPYGRKAERFLRSSVFIGTTNESTYLADPTGSRRFWPVKTHGCDLKNLERDRSQLFAEAYHRYKAGEVWWFDPDPDFVRSERDTRHSRHPWEEAIVNWLEDPIRIHNHPYVTTSLLLEKAVERQVGQWTSQDKKSVTGIMTRMGWTIQRKSLNGKRRYVWVRSY